MPNIYRAQTSNTFMSYFPGQPPPQQLTRKFRGRASISADGITLEELTAEINEARAEFRECAENEIECYGEDGSASLEISFFSPETDEEFAERQAAWEQGRVDYTERRRQQYEELRREFEGS